METQNNYNKFFFILLNNYNTPAITLQKKMKVKILQLKNKIK